MVIHTMVNPKWFEQWNNVNETERDEEYGRYKMRFANHLFEWACVHFPKLKEKVNFVSYECCLNRCKSVTMWRIFFFLGNNVACSHSHQYAWAGGRVRIHAVCRAQSGPIPASEHCHNQVQHSCKEPLPIR